MYASIHSVYAKPCIKREVDHSRTLTDPGLPDEFLADIGPIMKKVAVMNGENAYNIVQVCSNPSRRSFRPSYTESEQRQVSLAKRRPRTFPCRHEAGERTYARTRADARELAVISCDR